MEMIYYGEQKCEAIVKSTGNKCVNGAYYKVNDQYLCGTHSKKGIKEMLPRNPDKNLINLKEHEKTILPLDGKIKCYKIKMMTPIPLINGYRNVFPNNKQQHRKDGFGCCELSPMRLGPITHLQPGLPIALNLENFHQFNKVFEHEELDGNPSDEFRKTQLLGYNDRIPHRHKFKGKNIPLYSVFKTQNGEKKFTYIQSRYFYCCFYEKLATQQNDFKTLQQFHADGINLIICGYDAYDVTEDLYKHYCDEKRPFGHELVLYTLLTVDPILYPWHLYRKNNLDVYEGVTI